MQGHGIQSNRWKCLHINKTVSANIREATPIRIHRGTNAAFKESFVPCIEPTFASAHYTLAPALVRAIGTTSRFHQLIRQQARLHGQVVAALRVAFGGGGLD